MTTSLLPFGSHGYREMAALLHGPMARVMAFSIQIISLFLGTLKS